MSDGNEMILRIAAVANEKELLFELERTIRSLRELPNSESYRNELILLCMVYTGKHLIDKHGLDSLLKDIKNIGKLHQMFTGRDN